MLSRAGHPTASRLAWVSTDGHAATSMSSSATIDARRRDGTSTAWPERRSRVTRYYYSPFDHEISPTWSPDGKELIYVGNPEASTAPGGLWRRALSANAEPVPCAWKRRRGKRGPPGHRMASAFCTPRMRAVSGTSSGSPRRRRRRSTSRSRTESSTTPARAGRLTARALPSSRTAAAPRTSGCRMPSAPRSASWKFATRRYRQPMGELHVQHVGCRRQTRRRARVHRCRQTAAHVRAR